MTQEVIQFFGASSGEECGYCKNKRQEDYTYGMWTYSLSPLTYQMLIDRNWRRSGKYTYKPQNDKICCPMYTIRTDAIEFKLRKSHKKVIKTFNNYIKYDIKPEKAAKAGGKIVSNAERPNEMINKRVENVKFGQQQQASTSAQPMEEGDTHIEPINVPTSSKPLVQANKSLSATKKKFQRRQRYVERLMKRTNCSAEEAKQHLYEKSLSRQKTKSLETFLSEYANVDNAKHTFRTVILPSNVDLPEFSMDASYKLYDKYNSTIHSDKKNTMNSFKRFLVDSPLSYVTVPGSTRELPLNYGSYHQLYYIDDRLVAVGVLDLLPKCITSVYLFYDPDYSFLNLGIYSALNEIALVRKLQQKLPKLIYYYMGFYIHSCPKMIYKAQFQPADLLCSETFRWCAIDSCTAKLAGAKYARFCDDRAAVDKEGGDNSDPRNVKLIHANTGYTYEQFVRKHKPSDEILEAIAKFASLAGGQVVKRVWFYVHDPMKL